MRFTISGSLCVRFVLLALSLSLSLHWRDLVLLKIKVTADLHATDGRDLVVLVDKVTPNRHSDAAEPAATTRHLANDRPLIGADVIALDRVVVAVPAFLAAAHVDPAVDDGDAGPVATLVHGGTQLPAVGARVEALDLVRVLRRRVPATCSVIRHTRKRQHNVTVDACLPHL